MKFRFFTFAWSLVFGLWFFVPAGHAAEQLWTCGMHPQIIKKEPGNCPICGMKLTPLRANGPAAAGADAHAIQVEPAIVQRMNLKTAIVKRGTATREIRTFGSVAFDESGLRDITTKYDGWIEKLYVDTTWVTVKAGDPLFEVYSPDLYNAQLNYVAVHGTDGGDTSAGPRSVWTRSARGRLELYDVPPDVIAQLDKTGKAQRTFLFRAPSDGVVIDKSGVTGQMMRAGERIYQLADLSRVWVLAQLNENDLPFVKAGDEVRVQASFGPERELTGKVSLIVPRVDDASRTATARIVLPNPDGALKPGMYVDVRFKSVAAENAVLVPETAILRGGERNIVFLAKDGGTFDARAVKLGVRSASGDYVVLSGLKEGERVVTSGQFMLDSESQLREAIEKMSSTGAATPSSAVANGNATGTSRPQKIPSQEAATPELTALANATADAAAALAADDLDGYNEAREGVNAALDAWSKSRAGSPLPAEGRSVVRALPQASDLKAARDAFEPFSTAVTDLAREAHLDRTAGLHAFECPMPPSGSVEKGRWLQHTAGTKNPFYGSAMPTCGGELK